jgi:hypothetical protein
MDERGTPGAPLLPFAYHNSLAPMMWVLVALATLELFAVHLLVALWNPPVAALLSVLTLGSILWFVNLIRSFKPRPVLVDGNGILLRAGRLREIRVPFENIEGLRTSWASGAQKAPTVLNLALISYPNVLIDLRDPVEGRRGRRIVSVAHRLDDLPAFLRVVEPCLKR